MNDQLRRSIPPFHPIDPWSDIIRHIGEEVLIGSIALERIGAPGNNDPVLKESAFVSLGTYIEIDEILFLPYIVRYVETAARFVSICVTGKRFIRQGADIRLYSIPSQGSDRDVQLPALFFQYPVVIEGIIGTERGDPIQFIGNHVRKIFLGG